MKPRGEIVRSENRPPYELLCIAAIFLCAAVMLFLSDGGGVVLMHSGGSRYSAGPVTGAETVSQQDMRLIGIIPLILGLLTIWLFLRVRKELGFGSRTNNQHKK